MHANLMLTNKRRKKLESVLRRRRRGQEVHLEPQEGKSQQNLLYRSKQGSSRNFDIGRNSQLEERTYTFDIPSACCQVKWETRLKGHFLPEFCLFAVPKSKKIKRRKPKPRLLCQCVYKQTQLLPGLPRSNIWIYDFGRGAIRQLPLLVQFTSSTTANITLLLWSSVLCGTLKIALLLEASSSHWGGSGHKFATLVEGREGSRDRVEKKRSARCKLIYTKDAGGRGNMEKEG